MSHSATPDNSLDVLIVGAGQAGLSLGYHLAQRGYRFLLVDAAPEIGHAWSARWDSLRLFSPAQYDALPGMDFPAPADTYPTKEQVADYLVEYASRFSLPVLLDAAVTRLERSEERFVVHTTRGTQRARQIVVATGPFQRPMIPALAATLSPDVVQLHSADYRNVSQLPGGPVLVVGAGNSGMQIAEEIAQHHDVTLAVGAKSPELPQRLLSKDLFWWLTKLGAMKKTADSRIARRMRARGDIVIGSSLKALRRHGVAVRPRVTASAPEGVTFADGERMAPRAVVWATGFRSDYSWIDVPGLLVEGEVAHRRGVTEVPGLYFLGLTWQHTRGSALLGFVKEDAAWIADRLEERRAGHDVRQPTGSRLHR